MLNCSVNNTSCFKFVFKLGRFLEHSKSTHALGRAGEAEEVAKAIVFLASNKLSGFMTVSVVKREISDNAYAWLTVLVFFLQGVTLPVDGGRGVMCPR